MTTGQKIRKARLSKGMTQEELGKVVGVGKAAINKYELGIVVNIKQSVLAGLAKALDVSPLYLLDLEPDTIEIKEEPATRMDDELLDAKLIRRLTSLTPAEREKVDSFVQGLLAARE